MVKSGLDIIVDNLPKELMKKQIGVLCHAPSITKDFRHILDIIKENRRCRLAAIFGPQHGIFGETQDNMIEWEGNNLHPYYNVPVHSLYGEHRKPTPKMLEGIDVFLVDLQDIGARLYTYIWTVKLCIEACMEAGIPIVVLDRPNPIARLALDGPVLKPEFFTFVGGASIPLCHKMTIGEMANWIKEKYYPKARLKVIKLEGWNRKMFYDETGLPWVIPSPNMPTLSTAIVYPGTVLIEALNLSEGRGTTKPFELIGAPWLDARALKKNLDARNLWGCAFRIHNYIPTFHKYAGKLCNGIQIHITDRTLFHPVTTALEIFDAIIETSPDNSLLFNPPPYEYEEKLMPFDILAGDSITREVLINRGSIIYERVRWFEEGKVFQKEFKEFSLYE
jgi:uncharacterized protein YbbC (DUF1343 family)